MDNTFKFHIKKIRNNPIVDFLQTIVISLIIVIVLYTLVITPNEVEGSSMEPNFHTGERVYTNRVSEWLGETPFGKSLGLDYAIGDIIVFKGPSMDAPLIKRVIGIQGNTIELKDKKVYVNGKEIIEDYLPAGLLTNSGTFMKEGEIKKIPNNHYFVMGDNRTVSLDSRYIQVGFIDRDWVLGKVVARVWPLEKLSIIHGQEYKTISY